MKQFRYNKDLKEKHLKKLSHQNKRNKRKICTEQVPMMENARRKQKKCNVL